MTGTDASTYPITPLEPALSKQKLLQLAREELTRNLPSRAEHPSRGNGVNDHEDEHDQNQNQADTRVHHEDNENADDSIDYDTDDESDASSSYEEDDEDDNISVQLVGLNINNIPTDLIDLYKDHVSKLSLKTNWLDTLPKQFMNMAQLVYLDISNNRFTEFPSVLCECPNLEILDISSNQIKDLPKDIGHLDQLKCLSMFNNRFEYLPPCIVDMTDLQILEVEHNPLVMPPKSLVEPKPAAHEQLEWIESIKHYLGKNRDQIYALLEKPKDDSPVYGSTNPSAGSLSAAATFKTIDNNFKLQPPPLPKFRREQQNQRPPQLKRSVSEAPNNDEFFDNAAAAAVANSDAAERLRSNSESHASSRAAKRMGFIVKKPNSMKEDVNGVVAAGEKLPTPQEVPNTETAKGTGSATPLMNSSTSELPSSRNQSPSHTRAPSHDSSFEPHSTDHSSETSTILQDLPKQKALRPPKSRFGSISESPVMDSVSGAYFRRLSTLNENMNMTEDRLVYEMQDKIVESSRKILFALSELHSIIRRCAGFCEDKQLLAKMMSLLQASKSAFPQLVATLEKLEKSSSPSLSSPAPPPSSSSSSSSSPAAPNDSGDSSDRDRDHDRENAHEHGRDLEDNEAQRDREGTNAVINSSIQCLASFRNLTAFLRANLDKISSYVDVKFLRSLIMTLFQSFSELHNAWHVVYPTRTISRQFTRQNFGRIAQGKHVASPMIEDVLRNGEGLSAADDQMYDKVFQAASTAQTVLGQLTGAVSKSAAESVQDRNNGVNSTVASKVKDLMQTSVMGVETTRRLMARLDQVRNKTVSMGHSDRRKFWDDLNAFLKAVIGILASTKSAMPDLPSLNDVRPNLAKLSKLAKEIPLMLEYSSYKQFAIMNSGDGPSGQQTQQNQQVQVVSAAGGTTIHANAVAAAAALPPPTTPLVAVLGANAAQAVVSPSTLYPSGYSPFIPESQQPGVKSSNTSPKIG